MSEQAHLSVEGLEHPAVVRILGREGINELSDFSVDVLCKDGQVDPATLMDRDAVLSVQDDAGEIAHFELVVLEASHRGRLRDRERYRLRLGAPMSRLMLRVNHEIFQDKTSEEIVTALITRVGFPASALRWRLVGQYPTRVYTVQYGESDWSFISRLLADEGINYWFDHDGADPVIVFGDHGSSHDSIQGEQPTVPFHDVSGANATSFSIHSLVRTWSLTPTKYFVRDQDVQHPDVPVDGEAGDGALEIFEYPSNLMVADAAKARAKVRLEQVSRHRSTLLAASGNARLRPGRIVEITGAADDHHNGKHLIIAVEHRLMQDAQGDARGEPYANQVTLVPLVEDVPYRPAPPHSAPRADGLESAVVTGPSGEEIHVDDLGRVKVRFLWDRSGIQDDKSSRWIRTLQMNLQAPQILPRVGWEVPVVYEHGDPDRPFVLGRLYNAGAPQPYGTPAKQATSTFQSATSPSDGTTQEIRMGDDAGSEEVFVHATKDQSVMVGGSHTVTVGADRTDDVKKGQSFTIDGTQTTSVGGDQKITIGADGAILVKGARSETIGGDEAVTVTGSYSLQSKSSYAEVVGGLYSLRCNQSNTKIQGAFTQVVGAAMSTTAGLGSNQSVAGARTEVVGGARTFNAGLVYADGTTGVKKVTAGAANESASTDMTFDAGARLTMQAGGLMTLDAGGAIVFEATTMTVKAATLTAKGGATMKLAGGLKSSGTVKLEASATKKTDNVKVQQ